MLKTIRQIQLLILCVCWQGHLTAQFSVNQREKTALENNRDDDFMLFSLQEKGLLLFKVQEPWKYAGQKKWKISIKDKNLNTVYEQEQSLPYVFSREQFYFYDERQNFYLLAEEVEKDIFHVLKIDVNNQNISYSKAASPIKFIFHDFIALDNHVFLVGSTNNKEVVLDFNLLDSKVTVMPSFYNDEEELNSFHLDKNYNFLHFTVTNRKGKFCSMYVKPYSNLLGFSANHLIQKGKYKKESPKWSYTYTPSPQSRWVLGLYSLDCSRYAQGLFVSKFEQAEEKKTRYYKFIDMRNFFSRFSEKRAIKMREKVKKRRQSGKELQVSNYTLANMNVKERQGNIIMSFEGYTSSSANVNNNPYSSLQWRSIYARRNPYYPNPLPNSTLQQQSIQRYNYGLVCAFDSTGKLLWDNIMDLESLEDSEIRTHMELGFLEDSTILAYFKDKKIYSKMIHKKRTIKEIQEQELTDLISDEKTEFIGADNFFHWYDNHFILWGVERKQGGVIFNSKFFHITKLSYYPEPDKEEADNKKGKTNKKK